ncbi:phage tail protein [Mesorhizobium sp. 8]|uniref:TipJ family phage tail tip protein n=1 Tax=Mesorhizobium sp. 8 TaxID=2584466 RepID=UPI0015D66C0B|nr:phage tail protein [Mesorhizobium sp. 8]
MLVYREQLGIELPDYATEYLDDRDRTEIAAIAAREKVASRWQKVEEPRPFDILLFSIAGDDSHVGICIEPGQMLHTVKDDHAKIGRYDVAPWRDRFVGAYRWVGDDGVRAKADPAPSTPPVAGSRVVVAPYAMDIDRRREEIVVPAGLTVAEIVALTLPDLPEAALPRVRVTLVSVKGTAVIPQWNWRLVRPYPSTSVVITIGHGAGALSLLVQVAATAISNSLGGALAGTLGLSAGAWSTIIGFGITAIGGILINALFQPKKQKQEKDSFVIDGWQNEYRPDEPVPVPFGEIRHSPPFAAASYIEVVGDILYNRAVFLHGLGQLELWDHKIGDTSIDDYDEFQIEHRGAVGSPDSSVPFTLYTQQVIEDSIGTDLVWQYERDDAGNQLDTMDEKKPVRRSTARNASHAIVILQFPQGLGWVSGNGNKKSQDINISVRIRKAGTDVWIAQPDIAFTAKKFAGFYRAIRVDFPSRGAWEIELTRNTLSENKEDAKETVAWTCTWAVLQSFRPEYPFNTDLPLCMTAMRVKATYQMNGQVQTYNCMTRRVTDDFGHGWPTDIPRNAATSALYALLGPGLFRAEASARIDWARFIEWRDYCTLKNLKFDLVVEGRQSLGDTLKMIGAAGRASVYFDGSRWTVIIDKPRDTPIDVITPRNASNVTFEVAYAELPDALRIKFQDAQNDYQPAERIVRRPGLAGPVMTTEAMEMPGKTDPDEIYREAVRRFYELEYRNVVYRVTQQGIARSATRGDLVLASKDILRRTMASARVKAVRGNLIEIDETWTIKPNVSYAVGFRVLPADEAEAAVNPLGQHVVRKITAIEGDTKAFVLQGDGLAPSPGTIIMLGEYGSESIPLILTGIQRREDGGSDLTLLPAAPEIDALTDAIPIPTWDGKVGEVVDQSGVIPEAPRVVWVRYDAASAKTMVRLEPAPTNVVELASYTVSHRLAGAGGWSTATSTASSAMVELPGYTVGDQIELQVRATSAWGTAGTLSGTISVTITGTLLPSALPADAIQIIGKLGQAEITFATGPDVYTDSVRIYRDGTALPATVPVSPNGTFGRIDGDSTRTDLVIDGGFDADANWTKGTGWTISAGHATKTAGIASDLSQVITMTAGKVYRGAATVTGRTAGAITPKITGGAAVAGAAVLSDGRFLFQIVAGAAPVNLVFSADAAFNGSLDDVTLVEETPACLEQGDHTYKLEPLNVDGDVGPQSAPITVTVV